MAWVEGVELELYFENGDWKRPHKEEVRGQAIEISRERVFTEMG